jgi:hypothetical protein
MGLVFTTAGFWHFWEVPFLKISDLRHEKNSRCPESAKTGKPINMTEDIFIAEILGHKLLPSAAALSVGQSYKDFYIRKP